MAATNHTIILWHYNTAKNIYSADFSEAECVLDLDDTITCLKAFEGKAFIGTKSGELIIFNTQIENNRLEFNELDRRSYENEITSIRLYKKDSIVNINSIVNIIVCFDKTRFIHGKFVRDKLRNLQTLYRHHLVHDAQYVTNGNFSEYLSVGLHNRLNPGIYIQRREEEQIEHISTGSGAQILDISDKGKILIDSGYGDLYLRDSTDYSLNTAYNNHKGLVDYGSGLGALISSSVGCCIVYAGNNFKDLIITNCSTSSPTFFWGLDEKHVKSSISSIDSYENSIILGLRESFIVFKIDVEKSAPMEPNTLLDTLHKHQKYIPYTESTSESENESEGTVDDTHMMSESESESTESSHSGTDHASDLNGLQDSRAKLIEVFEDIYRKGKDIKFLSKVGLQLLGNK